MKALKDVTVGIDFSEASHATLNEAARIAKWNGARLHVCHVAPADELEDIQWPDVLPEGFLMEKARAKLRDFVVENLRLHPRIEFEVCQGNPFHQISNMVRDTGSGLLVLGSHGLRGGGERIGTVAAKCVRKVPLPVLLVRGSQKGPFRKVVACTDFSETADLACDAAADVAMQDGSELHLVHVHTPPWVSPAYMVYDIPVVWGEEQKKSYTKGIVSKLKAKKKEIERRFVDVELSCEVLENGAVVDGVAGYLEKNGADLVVLGSRGRSGIRSVFFGTTAEQLVKESSCSALVVKPEGEHGTPSW